MATSEADPPEVTEHQQESDVPTLQPKRRLSALGRSECTSRHLVSSDDPIAGGRPGSGAAAIGVTYVQQGTASGPQAGVSHTSSSSFTALPLLAVSAEPKMTRLRRQAIAELITTEVGYLTHLYRLSRLFVLPLRDGRVHMENAHTSHRPVSGTSGGTVQGALGSPPGGDEGATTEALGVTLPAFSMAELGVLHIGSAPGDRNRFPSSPSPVALASVGTGSPGITTSWSPGLLGAGTGSPGVMGTASGVLGSQSRKSSLGTPTAASLTLPAPTSPDGTFASPVLPTLSTWEHERLFNDVHNLIPLHIMLLQLLAEAAGAAQPLCTSKNVAGAWDVHALCPDPNAVILSKVFLRVAPFFKSYSRYCYGHSTADADLRSRFMAEPKAVAPAATPFRSSGGTSSPLSVVEFIRLAERQPSCHGHPLESLLAMPVQRIPRYLLLLREISKHTPDDHTDKPALERAIVAVAQAASMLDSSVARHHNQMQVMKVQSLLNPAPEPSIVAPHREFIRVGSLWKVCRPYPRTKRYTFLLLSDLLIYGTIVGGEMCEGNSIESLGSRMNLHAITTLIGVDSSSHATSGTTSGTISHSFVVLGQPKSFICVADSNAEMVAWMTAISRCVATENAKRLSLGLPLLASEQAAPVLTLAPAQLVKTCGLCGKGFGVLTHRRDLCIRCGAQVCTSCCETVVGSEAARVLSVPRGARLSLPVLHKLQVRPSVGTDSGSGPQPPLSTTNATASGKAVSGSNGITWPRSPAPSLAPGDYVSSPSTPALAATAPAARGAALSEVSTDGQPQVLEHAATSTTPVAHASGRMPIGHAYFPMLAARRSSTSSLSTASSLQGGLIVGVTGVSEESTNGVHNASIGEGHPGSRKAIQSATSPRRYSTSSLFTPTSKGASGVNAFASPTPNLTTNVSASGDSNKHALAAGGGPRSGRVVDLHSPGLDREYAYMASPTRASAKSARVCKACLIETAAGAGTHTGLVSPCSTPAAPLATLRETVLSTDSVSSLAAEYASAVGAEVGHVRAPLPSTSSSSLGSSSRGAEDRLHLSGEHIPLPEGHEHDSAAATPTSEPELHPSTDHFDTTGLNDARASSDEDSTTLSSAPHSDTFTTAGRPPCETPSEKDEPDDASSAPAVTKAAGTAAAAGNAVHPKFWTARNQIIVGVVVVVMAATYAYWKKSGLLAAVPVPMHTGT